MTPLGRCGFALVAALTAGVIPSAQSPQSPQQTPPPQQQAPPTFRAGVRTVAVPTSVFNQHGDIVTHLRRDQFLIFDEGVRQELTIFESGQHPITALVLLDTSASMIPRLDLVRQAAEQFIVRLWPGDRARVGSFSDAVQMLGEFTEDRDALLRTLREDLHVGNPTRLIDAMADGMTALAPLPGRRVLVVFTDGCDTYSKSSWDGLLQRLPAEEFMVYAVQIGGGATAPRPVVPRYASRSPRGGCSGPEHEFEMSVLPAERLSDFLRINSPTRILTPTQILSRLTAETGGGHFALTPRDDVNATFTQVMFELHHQYLLGFSPQVPDGKRHTITVRVNDRDLIVRARRAYLAARP
jgi:VWFA-related protein